GWLVMMLINRAAARNEDDPSLLASLMSCSRRPSITHSGMLPITLPLRAIAHTPLNAEMLAESAASSTNARRCRSENLMSHHAVVQQAIINGSDDLPRRRPWSEDFSDPHFL